ncbi:STAS domain-containing protein [Mycobacterium sp. NPDC003323]
MTDTLSSEVPLNFTRHLRMETHWRDFDLAVVLVTGEVDAANAHEVLDYALSKALLCRRMVLDLTHVDFFACDCYQMLTTLRGRCLMADVDLSIQTGPVAGRMVQVCEQAAASRT